MLTKLKQLLAEKIDTEASAKKLMESETRLAAAALLVHASRIDGEVTREEDEKLARLLTSRFDLSQPELSELIASADIAERDAVDLFRFTSVLARHLDQSGRKKIVEMLWGIAFADGKIHEFEDNLVWRVAELLGVSTRDRMMLKKKVQTGQDGNGPGTASSPTDNGA